MKTVALETILVTQSIGFWAFALPIAIVAFALLALFQETGAWLRSARTQLGRAHLSEGFAWD
jgi:hypothetical protein